MSGPLTIYTTHGKKMTPTAAKQGRKIKKSFSISPESDSFIRRMRTERQANSESETLDALLSELMAIHEQRTLEAAYTNYYDSLTDEEVVEQSAWGAFSETQLVDGAR